MRIANRPFLVVAAPAAYVVALVGVTAADGLPLARDQLFLWLGLGLMAFSVRNWRSWPSLVLHWLPLFLLLVAYDFLRGAVTVPEAQAHITPQLDLDKTLFGGNGPTVWLQAKLWRPNHLHAWDYLTWCVYMSHFFVVWIVAAVLWRGPRARFRQYAGLVLTVTLGAFLTYWLYPAQPPWMAAQNGLIPAVDRVVPTVWGHLGVQTQNSVYENSSLVNTVAAMPSLHATYPLMLLLFFWKTARGWVRPILVAYPLAMAFALVYGGEHFFADVLAGWVMGLVSVLLVGAIARALSRSPEPAVLAPPPRRRAVAHPL